MSYTLERHSFSELLASAGELLHTPQRVSTFMTTDPLSRAIYTFKQVLMSAQLDIAGTFSVHPASPALLTSKGPHKALTNISRHFISSQSETSKRPYLCHCYSTWVR